MVGKPGSRGLGYHGGNDANANGRGRQADPAVTATMISVYYEMGSSGAVDFVKKAAFNEMFQVSAQTALASGVATSLSPP